MAQHGTTRHKHCTAECGAVLMTLQLYPPLFLQLVMKVLYHWRPCSPTMTRRNRIGILRSRVRQHRLCAWWSQADTGGQMFDTGGQMFDSGGQLSLLAKSCYTGRSHVAMTHICLVQLLPWFQLQVGKLVWLNYCFKAFLERQWDSIGGKALWKATMSCRCATGAIYHSVHAGIWGFIFDDLSNVGHGMGHNGFLFIWPIVTFPWNSIDSVCTHVYGTIYNIIVLCCFL